MALTLLTAGAGLAQLGRPIVLFPGSTGTSPRVSLRPFASLQAFYQEGFAPSNVDQQGQVTDFDSTGGSASFGVYGYHPWRHSSLGVLYHGRARVYTLDDSYNGIDHTLALSFAHQPTPRVAFELTQTAGLYSRGLGLPGLSQVGGLGVGLNQNLLPEAHNSDFDLIDTRTYYGSSSAAVTYRPSARLAYSVSGMGFLVHRRAPGLAGVIGYTAAGQVGYALSRASSVALMYTFGEFDYTRAFGEARVQTLGVSYSRRLSQRWSGSFGGGVYRLNRLGITRRQLDPVVAAILGQSEALEVFQGLNYGFSGGGNLRGEFRRSTASVGYNRGVLPGNGLVLAAAADSIYGAYNYSGIRDWSFGGSASLTQFSASQQTVGRFRSYAASAQVSRRLTAWMHTGGSVGLRRVHLGNYKRDSLIVAIGLTFSPGEFPVAFW